MILPGWYFDMMNDHYRNAMWEQAIKNQVTSDSIVLDIGCGSGILSMMAARAGAKHVYGCDSNKHLAFKAQDNIALNNYQDKVTIIPMSSFDLQVGKDLPVADILVSELIGNQIIQARTDHNYDLLEVCNHARENLLKPDGKMIPLNATARGYLVSSKENKLMNMNKVFKVCDFDLSILNKYSSSHTIVPPEFADVYSYQKHSPVMELMHFDFTRSLSPSSSQVFHTPVTKSGVCSGIIQWIKCGLDDTISFENEPNGKENFSHWWHVHYPFPKLTKVTKGEMLHLKVTRNSKNIFIEKIKGN